MDVKFPHDITSRIHSRVSDNGLPHFFLSRCTASIRRQIMGTGSRKQVLGVANLAQHQESRRLLKVPEHPLHERLANE